MLELRVTRRPFIHALGAGCAGRVVEGVRAGLAGMGDLGRREGVAATEGQAGEQDQHHRCASTETP